MLLKKADQDNYWILPGGKVELLEDPRTTLHRELIEETGYEAEIKDLLWIVENFSHLDGTDYHELAFIYTISPTNPTIQNTAWTHQLLTGFPEVPPASSTRNNAVRDRKRVTPETSR